MKGKDLEALIGRFDRVLASSEQEVVERIGSALDSGFRRLEKDLAKAFTKTEGSGLIPSQRSMLLILQIQEALKILSPENTSDLEDRLNGLISKASDNGLDLSEAIITGMGDAPIKSSIPVEALKYSSRDALQKILGAGSAYADKAAQIITQGLALGWGVRRVAGSLRQAVGMTRARAETVVRTATIQAQDSASRQSYKDNGIEYVIRIATQDQRVCGLCAARAGKVYPADQAPAVTHFNDRCYNAPYKKEWADLGLLDEQWLGDQAESARQRCQEDLDYGPSAFERSAGAIKAPKAIRSYRSKPGVLLAPTPDQVQERIMIEAEKLRKEFESEFEEGRENWLINREGSYNEILASKGKVAADEAYDKYLIKSARRTIKTQIEIEDQLEAERQAKADKDKIKRIEAAQKGAKTRELNKLKKRLKEQEKLAAKAFDSNKDPILSALKEKYGDPPLILPDWRRGAHFSWFGNIHMDSVDKHEIETFSDTYRHEWGHYLDWRLGKSRGAMFASTDYYQLLIKDGKKIKAEDLKESNFSYPKLFFQFDDIAQAATNSRLGGGHEEDYMRKPQNAATEAFANVIAIIGSGDQKAIDLTKKLVPKFFKAVMELLESESRR